MKPEPDNQLVDAFARRVNYCYDCELYKTRKTFVYQKKP